LKEGERATRALWAKAPELNGDKMIADAAAADVTRLICVGCDVKDSGLAADFVETRENCWAAVGIHPHEARRYTPAGLRGLAKLTARPRVVAVGECGLDYHYEHSPKAAQLEILEFQIELALKRDLPVIFHVREAYSDFWPVFDAYRGIRGVLHSFTGSAEDLEKALERGLYVGVNGIATFTKDPVQQEMYRDIPLESLLLETDAPFLAPAPRRGVVNQPKMVKTVAQFLSELRGEDYTALARATTSNVRKLFGI
jgi:TatD DNase family protein